VIGALPLVLILPGYALVAACLPQRSFDWAERLLLSVGTSIAATVSLSLVMYWLGLSLQTATWTIALAATAFIASLVAWQRRKQVVEALPSTTDLRLNLRQVILLGVAVAIGGAAIRIAQQPAPSANVSGYTQLWLVPTNSGNAGTYQLGVTSDEFTPVAYHIQVTVDGQVGWDWPNVQLKPGESWTNLIVLRADRAVTGTIEAVLYRADDPTTIYRRVKLQRAG
jgi:uncharacterized membrane protein